MATSPATPAGTPCCCNPADMVSGRCAARPTIINEKKTPIDSAVPEFWKVARIPDATPRYRAGTLPMIEEVLGAANMPVPIPFSAINNANAQYGNTIGRNNRPTKLDPKSTMPTVAKPRAPNRSESAPVSGPATKNPHVNGSMKIPAHRGVSA